MEIEYPVQIGTASHRPVNGHNDQKGTTEGCGILETSGPGYRLSQKGILLEVPMLLNRILEEKQVRFAL